MTRKEKIRVVAGALAGVVGVFVVRGLLILIVITFF